MSRVDPISVARAFADCADFTQREIAVGGGPALAWVAFLDGLVDGNQVSELILRPLTDKSRFPGGYVGSRLAEGLAYPYAACRRENGDEVQQDLLRGWCAVIPPGARYAVDFEVKSTQLRAISPPEEEKSVHGAKDSFLESLRSNTALVRRRILSSELKLTELSAGRGPGTRAAIFWLRGAAKPWQAQEVRRRLEKIDTGAVLSAGAVTEFLSDCPRSPFPQMVKTERPDRFCMNLLEGRVGVLVDGLPLGFLLPGTFSQFLKMPEDCAQHYLVASVVTLLRYLALGLTLLLPGFYVAVATYHQEMIPAPLMQSMIDAKQRVPFPPAVEVLAMLLSFELLQEAGLRLPSSVGQTVGIIGALIVGQSAVEARVVSPVVVVVVALAGIAGYAVPDQDMSAALRLCRFGAVLLAIALGMFGLCLGGALLLYHWSALESLGTPYLTPFVGRDSRDPLRGLVRRRHGAPGKRGPLP